MKKLVLAGFSMLAVVLLVLGSQTNVVGYQASQPLQPNDRINQKELLVQTVYDFENDKEVQKVILASQGKFLISFPTQKTFPILTKKQLNIVCSIGFLLLKSINKPRLTSFFKMHSFINNQAKEKIDAVLRNNTLLNDEITRLSLLNCPCSQSRGPQDRTLWHFPVLCMLLFALFWIGVGFLLLFNTEVFLDLITYFSSTVGCFWFPALT
jgi:hypothetical protein